MFGDCIKAQIQPATWAILGIKKNVLGDQFAHRGTGFAIDSQGHILTCWHVTYMDEACTLECDEFMVMQPELSAAIYQAKLVRKERDRDLALLKIVGAVTTTAARMCSVTVPFGKSCAAFGHPLSVTDVATKSLRIFSRAAAGIVSMPFDGPRFPGGHPIALYELDFFTHGGSSGGPVFLRNGDVFGLVSGSLLVDDGSGNKKRSNLSVAINIREAIEFLQPENINLKIRGSVKG